MQHIYEFLKQVALQGDREWFHAHQPGLLSLLFLDLRTCVARVQVRWSLKIAVCLWKFGITT